VLAILDPEEMITRVAKLPDVN